MRKASSGPGPVPSAGATDGETVPARASAGVAWHGPGIAVTLTEGQGGQAVSCQWLLRPYRQLTQRFGMSAAAAQDGVRVTVPARSQGHEGASQEYTWQALGPDTVAGFGGCGNQLPVHTSYLRPPARLTPVLQDVRPGLANRTDASKGAD